MKKDSKIIEEMYKQPYCRRCKKKLTEEEMNEAKETNFIPLCQECKQIINENLKKCLPLMQKLKL